MMTTRQLITLALTLCATGCSSANLGDSVVATQTESALGGGYLGLCCGTKTTLVKGIASAENLMFTSDGRLLVTGDDGIYDVRRDPSGQVTAVLLTPKESCKFSGLAEARGAIYAGCYDDTNSSVFAAALAPTLAFQSVASLPGVPLANGLAADAAGRIYVAETLKLQIQRLTFAAANPLVMTSQEVWLSGTGLGTDGLKIFDSAVYWTDFGNVDRAVIRPDGSAGPASILESGGAIFFDDLYVDDQGELVANSIGGEPPRLQSIGPLDRADAAQYVLRAVGRRPGARSSRPQRGRPRGHREGRKPGHRLPHEFLSWSTLLWR